MQIIRGRVQSLIFLLLLLPAWSGCSGCRQADSDIQAGKKPGQQTALEEFTFTEATPLPAGGPIGTSAVKVGHWFSVRQSIRSNQADQRGELRFSASVGPRAVDGATSTQDAGGFICQRPAVLPKGRLKRLDVRLLATTERLTSSAKVMTTSRFTSASSFVSNTRAQYPTMLGEEYFFVILTTRPERFAAFQAADWVRSPIAGNSMSPASQFRVVFPRTAGLLSLPETMLDWTSTAFVFWDDISPNELTSDQRSALTDWLHFGGRMIVNGDSMASELSHSDLGPLLPIEFSGMEVLEADALTELVDNWSVKEDDSQTAVAALVHSQASRIAIGGSLAKDAVSIEGTADLLAARRIGRGEVVMSRFDLTSDWLVGWRSRDSFFNAVALARPARDYRIKDGRLIQSYANAVDSPAGTDQAARPLPGALINSTLRLGSRDVRLKINGSAQTGPDNEDRQFERDEFAVHPYSGLGGWRDDSDVAQLLQSVLRQQSGVSIPPRPFVVRSLAIYLAILVPANYLLFRLLGRLEWAWLAVPVVAFIGAGWIARTVSLDLGLARNRSEVSLIELQPGYSRGHLTRFAAIYNSLSGVYRIEFESPDAAVAPIDLASRQAAPACLFQYGYGAGPTLDNFFVASNRTRIFHAEQIVSTAGAIELQGNRLQNSSGLRLIDAMVVRKRSTNQIEQATVDSLDAGASVRLAWTPLSSGKANGMIAPLIQSEAMLVGSARLVARLEESLPGMNVVPATPQQSSTTIVLAHLTHATQRRSSGDLTLMPSKKMRDRLLIDDELDPASVTEIDSP